MGYCMEMIESKFVIKKENFEKALDGLKSVFIPENMTCYDFINRVKYPHFRWVDNKTVVDSETLSEALEEIRYEPVFDNDGNIVNVNFTGEKYGDEDIFFNGIAQYVEPNSFIKFIGEDDREWTWLFDGSSVNQLYK